MKLNNQANHNCDLSLFLVTTKAPQLIIQYPEETLIDDLSQILVCLNSHGVNNPHHHQQH